MITPKKVISSEEVKQGARFVLFVEGGKEDALDVAVINELLPMISVRHLGASYSVKSVAQALYLSHPFYFFLIDRDHHSDEEVEQSWANFPDPATNNLLIWRRREFENYFLIPEFLLKSAYLVKSEGELRSKILSACKERLYLDAANLVIISIRESVKSKWVDIFTNPMEFRTKDEALQKIINLSNYSAFKDRFDSVSEGAEIVDRFESILEVFTGGEETIEYGSGRWLEFINGKKVLNQVINSSLFVINDRVGSNIQGLDKLKNICKDLVRKSQGDLPKDFQQLRNLFDNRVLKEQYLT